MPKRCRHPACEEGGRIHVLGKSGRSNPAIARLLGRDRTTIRREVRRNGGGRGYRYEQAQRRASARRSAASSVPGRMTPELWRLAEERLAEGRSPEQISGRLRREGVPMAGREWMYRHVRADRRAGGRLHLFLRRRGRKPDRKGGRHAGRGLIPGRTDISERPAVVEAKERVGDREADTIVGRSHSGALVSLTDRASKYVLLERVGRRTADADNGREFAGHAGVAKALDAGFFFATPYHSRERGPDEHVNGRVREYLPKGTDFRRITDAQVKAVEDRLNARPRKVLGYRTPYEVFHEAQAP